MLKQKLIWNIQTIINKINDQICQLIEIAIKQCQKEYTGKHAHLEDTLLSEMEHCRNLTKGPNIIN